MFTKQNNSVMNRHHILILYRFVFILFFANFSYLNLNMSLNDVDARTLSTFTFFFLSSRAMVTGPQVKNMEDVLKWAGACA